MNKSLIAATTAIAATMGFSTASYAADPVKVGVLATLEGTYTVLGEDGVRGLKTALGEIKNQMGGREVELFIGPTDASPDSAVRAARKVVEQDGVDIVIGPLSGSEGIAIRDYSKTQPDVTFINGISGAQETTYVDPSENFFRFNMDGAQWSAGLGEYIYNEKGYRSIATVGEDYSFIYTQVFGLVTEFCSMGGEVTERLWVPLGTKDFGSRPCSVLLYPAYLHCPNNCHQTAVIDTTTTEIADLIAGGVFAATDTRLDVFANCGKPYIGACGALDMVNFNAPETVPERYKDRLFYEHKFESIEKTVTQTSQRQVMRVPHNINDPAFADLLVKTFRSLNSHTDVNPKRA